MTNGVMSFPADQCGAWVDWNNDGDFSDANETITVSGTPGTGPYTASVIPPSGTINGGKTMRIRITYAGTPLDCGTTTYGEVEDYTINVTGPNYWTGAYNYFWHNDLNWSQGHIPTADEDAVITSAGYNPPKVDILNEACKNLIIESGELVVKGFRLDVNGDVVISGKLTMDNPSGLINVKGNWINYVGPAGFTAGTGRVSFNGGAYHQYCNNETFNILEVNKAAGGALRPYLDHNIVCAAYDWTAGAVDVFAGSFTANDLLDNGISGAFYCNPGGTINLINSGANAWVDLNGELHIYGGTVNVYGSVSDWPFNHSAVIEMTSGVLDFPMCGINIGNNNLLTSNITGGTIRTASGFMGGRADFTPTAGTFEFYGSGDAYIYQSNGCTLHDVVINKSAKSPSDLIPGTPVVDERSGQVLAPGGKSNSIILGTDFTITNNLSINAGSFILNGFEASVGKYCHVYGSLSMTNASDKLFVGTTSGDNLEFHAGSSSTLTAGAIYPASWVWSSGPATVNGGPGNTIYFNGSNLDGVQVDGPGSVFGNFDVNKASGYFYIGFFGVTTELAGNLALHAGNTIFMQNVPMLIHGTLTDDATSIIHLNFGEVKGGNEALISASGKPGTPGDGPKGGSLTIDTDFTLKGLLNVGNGNVLLHGKFGQTSTGSLLINGGSFISDAPNHAKGWEFLNGNLTMSAGLFELTYNSIYFGPTATTTVTGGTLRTGEAFYAASPGNFLPTGGVVEVTGGIFAVNLHCGNGNHFYDLLINKSPGSPAFLALYDIIIKNNLTIQNGILNSDFYNINIGGNWTNNVGAAGFVERTGTVTFDGAAAADILTSETFYNLNVNKSYAAFDALELLQNVNVTGDLHVFDGSVKLRTPANLNVTGNLTIDLNAGLNAGDSYGPQVLIGKNWTNANTSYDVTYGFHPGNFSTVTFNGTVDQVLTSASVQEAFNNLRINKSAGSFRTNDNLLATGNAEILSGIWDDNVFGLTHTVYGDFTVMPGGSLYNATNQNTFEFAGSRHSLLTYSGITGYFHHLLINKAVGYSVTQVGNTSCQNSGNLTVDNGYYFLNGYILTVTGNIAVNSAAYLSLAPASSLVLTNTKSLNVNSGGRLEMLGTSGSPVNISANNPASRYALNVNSGGTIAADYCIFRNMGTNGVNVLAGGLVDLAHSFKGCMFRDGAAGGTLLTLNNSQVMTIRNAVFPANTWSGASNVTKTPATGHVYFVDFSGAFSGENFDADGNNLIDWVPALTALATATPTAICPGSSSQLNVTRTGGLAAYSYQWSPATGLSNPNIINPVASPASSVTYYVTVTDALGTAATSNILVTVNPVLPAGVTIAASANPSPPATFVMFTPTPVNGGSSPSYQWKVNNITVGSGATYSYKPLNNDHVTCVMTSNFPCVSGNPASSNTITMIVVPTNTPVSGIVPAGLNLCFDASNTVTVAGGGNSFVVKNGAGATMIAGTKISYLPTTKVEPGGYMHGYITTTNAYCGNLPPAMVTKIADEEEILSDPLSDSRMFTIYPNPTTGVFTMQYKSEIFTGSIQVEMFDMRGNRFLSDSYPAERSHTFTLSDLPAGLYFIKVIKGDLVESLKLIITR